MADELRALFATAIEQAYPGCGVVPTVAASNPKFADYQCNNAMALHGRMKGKVTGRPRLLSANGGASACMPVPDGAGLGMQGQADSEGMRGATWRRP